MLENNSSNLHLSLVMEVKDGKSYLHFAITAAVFATSLFETS